MAQMSTPLDVSDKSETASDLINLFLQEINKGSVLAISLLTLLLVISAGLVAEAVSKAEIRSSKIRDGLALTEASGKTVAALTGIYVLGSAAASAVGNRAVGAAFFLALLFAFIGFALITGLLFIVKFCIRKFRSASAQPLNASPPAPLTALASTAESVAEKAEHLLSRFDPASPLYSDFETLQKDARALEKQLKQYKFRVKKLTGF